MHEVFHLLPCESQSVPMRVIKLVCVTSCLCACRPVLLMMQRDVTDHVLQEQQLLELTEGQLAMLSQV